MIYIHPGCTACQRQKKFLSQKGVEFTEKKIQEDEQALLKELLKLGALGTPITVIDGKAVVGFDPRKLGEKLGL